MNRAALCLASSLLVATGGCLTTAAPRVADPNPAGKFSIMATWPIAGFAPGRTDGKRAGNTVGALPPLGGMISTMFAIASVEVSASVGLGHGCETGVIVGINRLGAEGRCAVLDEREGAAVSIAPFVRGGYQPGPTFLPGGPWFAAGVDLSAGGTVAFSPTVSYDAEAHALTRPSTDLHQQDFFVASRREWRLSFPIGLAITPRASSTRGGRVMFGVVPYWTFAHGAAGCASCESATEEASAASFGESWGLLFTIAGGSVPLAEVP